MNEFALWIIVVIVTGALIAVLMSRGLDVSWGKRGRNRLLRSGRHTNEKLINNPLIFHTSADLDTVAAKLIADIAPPRAPESQADLHLALAEPTGDGSSFVLFFCAGAGASKTMETAVLLKPSGSGTSGSVGIETWQTVDGVIDAGAITTARSVRDGVRRVVAQLDSAAEFRESA